MKTLTRFARLGSTTALTLSLAAPLAQSYGLQGLTEDPPAAPTARGQGSASAAESKEVAKPVEDVEIEGVHNVHRVGRLLLAGQPSAEGLGRVAETGVRNVISLRKPGEVTEFDEPVYVVELGMTFSNPSFGGPDELTPEVFDRVRELLREHRGEDTLLHCGSANRVGAVWLATRTLDEGVAWRQALAEAHRVGLRSVGYESQARDYVRRVRRPEWAAALDKIRTQFPGVRQLSTDALAVELDGDADPLVLDVRAPEEYAVSHLPGAHLASDLAAAQRHIGDSPKDRPIVAYCSIGHRSSGLAQELTELGFTNVSNLEGSIFEWANQGHPVVRDGKPVGVVHPYNKRWGRFLDRELWGGALANTREAEAQR